MKRTTNIHLAGAVGADPSLRSIYAAADQERKQQPKRGGDGDKGSADAGGSKKLAKKGKELKDSMDALVDEIDEVLEENAEEFVKNYVQRGGE